jgi:hypothetical protein
MYQPKKVIINNNWKIIDRVYIHKILIVPVAELQIYVLLDNVLILNYSSIHFIPTLHKELHFKPTD